MDNLILHTVITVVCAVIASSGFWNFLQKKEEGNDARKKMLMGLGHDRIVSLGMEYVNRGWITNEEFENINNYLYKPYLDLGGDGVAKRVMDMVLELPIKNEIKEKL